MNKKILGWISLFFIFFFISGVVRELLLPFAEHTLDILQESIVVGDNGFLVIASVRSVIYECLIDLPIFLLGYSFVYIYYQESSLIQKLFYLVLSNLGLYAFNCLIFTDEYEIIILGFILLSQMILFYIFHENKENFLLSLIVLIQLSLAFYGLLLTPVFDNLGIGYRDLITSIKLGTEFFGGKIILNFVSLFIFIPMFTGAILLILISIIYSLRLKNEQRERKQQRELSYMRSVAEEARVWQELRYLVHDLKSPLMTVTGLNSLIDMKVEDDRIKEYCKKIDESVEVTNELISEFLNNEKRKVISVEELMKAVRANVINKNEKIKFTLEIAKDLPYLRVNRIRMYRALSNIIENSLRAVKYKDDALIFIKVKANNEGNIIIAVKDNGVGISKENLEQIWNVGFTTKVSSGGLGLSFVKKVIEDHEGKIKINTEMGQGTEVVISLPGVKNNESDINNRG